MKYKHYNFKYKEVKIDPYRIMYEYKITHPAHQHALKKLLRAGNSIKDLKQDIQEVIDSLERWIEMIDEDEQVEQKKKSFQFVKETPMSVQKSCATCKHDLASDLCSHEAGPNECLYYSHWEPKNIHEILRDAP